MRTSNHRSLRSSLSTVPYSSKIQWPTRYFVLSCAAKQITAVSVPYCVSKNDNLLLHHNSQIICIEVCMRGTIFSIN